MGRMARNAIGPHEAQRVAAACKQNIDQPHAFNDTVRRFLRDLS